MDALVLLQTLAEAAREVYGPSAAVRVASAAPELALIVSVDVGQRPLVSARGVELPVVLTHVARDLVAVTGDRDEPPYKTLRALLKIEDDRARALALRCEADDAIVKSRDLGRAAKLREEALKLEVGAMRLRERISLGLPL